MDNPAGANERAAKGRRPIPATIKITLQGTVKVNSTSVRLPASKFPSRTKNASRTYKIFLRDKDINKAAHNKSMVNHILEALLGKETPPRGIRAVGPGKLEWGLDGYFVAFYDPVDIPALKELIERRTPSFLPQHKNGKVHYVVKDDVAIDNQLNLYLMEEWG